MQLNYFTKKWYYVYFYALFGLVAWPFSLKLLWAPLVDSFYVQKMRRRNLDSFQFSFYWVCIYFKFFDYLFSFKKYSVHCLSLKLNGYLIAKQIVKTQFLLVMHI